LALVAVGVAVAAALFAFAGVANGEPVPTADLAIVSKTADVRHAKIGQEVTFTIVATNFGPDAADLNVVEDPGQLYPDRYPRADFQLGEEVCDFGISPDSPACEYSLVQPGETVKTVAVMTVMPTAGDYASNTACVFSWDVPIIDPNPANDCVTMAVKIVGKRHHH
jgi:hypothetical protein